jgi:hypothetical protein
MMHRWLAIGIMVLIVAVGVRGDDPCSYTPRQLIRMQDCQLQEIYRHGRLTAAPCGSAKGWAIIKPGRLTTVPRTHLTRLLWQGKEFSCDGGTMINHAFGIRIVQAQVYQGESWLDGQPSLIFDYQCTSKLFAGVRDEVREIGPGLYLGLTHIRKPCGPELVAYFVLQSPNCACR